MLDLKSTFVVVTGKCPIGAVDRLLYASELHTTNLSLVEIDVPNFLQQFPQRSDRPDFSQALARGFRKKGISTVLAGLEALSGFERCPTLNILNLAVNQ
jgi:hypothetical protein